MLEKLPFQVEVVQSDPGAEFQGAFQWPSSTEASATSAPSHPPRGLKGKVERSHRIDAEEFYPMLDGVVIDDTGLFDQSSRNGRTSTTSTAPTAASVDRLPTSGYDRRPRPRL